MRPKKSSRLAKAPASANRTKEFERLLKDAPSGIYVLRLYVTGTTPRSALAIANIRALCEEHLAGRYDLQVIDLYQQPTQAAGQQIIAAPTLVKESPFPARRMVGDFSDQDKVLVALNLPVKAGSSGVKWLEV